MNTAKVVIGANYGDEGKGLLTDYFASQAASPEDCLVVRFNGGAQAGHTVANPDGKRHVFSHFGSGSFLGCPTYLSQFFVVNPLLFARELGELAELSVKPKVLISESAMLTTPFDMFINQLAETTRGSARHGSCGVGINETVTRCLSSRYLGTYARDLLDLDHLRRTLKEISQLWLPQRLQRPGFDDTCRRAAAQLLVQQENIIEKFIEDAQLLLASATITSHYPRYSDVVFEGAQGLMLDEDRIDQWPHVTRSKTGLDNVVYLAEHLQIERLEVTYASRSYLTRHGAGPLPGECNWKFGDTTNVPNTFQGTLRFAPLSISQLNDSINKDLLRARRAFPNIEAALAMTCADQFPIPARADLKQLIVPVTHVSYGPTRSHVRELQPAKPERLCS